MASNIICIFPKDETTDFLLPIYESLGKIDSFLGFRSDNNEELFQSVSDAINAINAENNLIVFLGHGASNCLYGTPVNGLKTKLFELSNVDLFDGQNIFLLACRSAEFINSILGRNIVNGIGFGDIITEYREVVAERDTGDSSFLPDIDNEAIEEFKNSLVNVASNTFNQYIEEDMSFENLFSYLKLMINKEISELLINKEKVNCRVVSDLLFDLKNEITLVV